ncbi:MAG: hypothetical protein HY597_02180 [Candidatus Omnitrophica bacterium]|nr:hypothetical protein [Candidatus Omnitrophota bacterium]
MANERECSSGSCDVETQAGSCSSAASTCPCGTDCGGDPIECAAGMWMGAFCQAMKQVQVELLKVKIQKAWGSKMEKAADAVVEAAGVQWQTMLAQAQAKSGFREKLRSLWSESR